MRKAVLEERFPGTSNTKALEGTLLHDLLQVCRIGIRVRSRFSVRLGLDYSLLASSKGKVYMH